MGRRELQKEKKIALLEFIKAKRNILFGNFKYVTNIEKQKAWEDVLLKAKSLELATDETSWTYARDDLFGLWKSRTLGKRDNMRRTGTGGSFKTLDGVDRIILNILEEDSKVVDGLGLPESRCEILLISGEETNNNSENWENPPPPVSIVAAPCETSAPNMTPDGPTGVRKRQLKTKTDAGCSANRKSYAEEAERLKVELLKVEIYHRKLQARKLEKELGLLHSEFTSHLP